MLNEDQNVMYLNTCNTNNKSQSRSSRFLKIQNEQVYIFYSSSFSIKKVWVKTGNSDIQQLNISILFIDI
jgi:hypothetical protein